MKPTQNPLTMTDIFSDQDRENSKLAVWAIEKQLATLNPLREQLQQLELQQFAFDLKDFLMAQRREHGDYLLAFSLSMSSHDSVYYFQRKSITVGHRKGCPPNNNDISEQMRDASRTLEDFLKPYAQIPSLQAYFSFGRELTISNIHLCPDEGLLALVMRGVLGDEGMALRERRFLATQIAWPESYPRPPMKIRPL